MFRNLVQQDKMSLGISCDQNDFSASCMFVKVRRNQLLEVCDALPDLARRMRKIRKIFGYFLLVLGWIQTIIKDSHRKTQGNDQN